MFSQRCTERIKRKGSGKTEVVVGVGDMKLSKDITKTIVTYSLGSCIGITVYDPVKKIAGMLHYMLPNADVDKNRKKVRKLMFADTAIPILLEEACKMGAEKKRLTVKIAGGGNMMDPDNVFSIGKRNYSAAKSILCSHGIIPDKESIGGRLGRTLYFHVGSGDIFLKFSGKREIVLF